ncbi:MULTISPECIES: NAD(P)H-dependent glycerol-3-phosphate dehydrogenase [Allobaculum]|uniref:NAD(P)H-dependent glycerol-3-phosphate dehydrogenase n=1 Tax=Allobaculum TaxID=174708 RepID=UPI001E4551DB|nr:MULTISPECIES: NAD(P)H-dependent glycerol-3-phosphate dehydrogenase [Allobaculum]UNT92410.1 NAD(P)-dependent glycerol-3-phosphate dehydrogenase [Allobaculum sp. Allo2]
MKTVVIGSGSWGTALAQVLCDNHQPVELIGVDDAEIQDINQNHKNSKYFRDVDLNPALHATKDWNVLNDADVVLFAVPTAAIESVASKAAEHVTKPVIAVNVSKGFNPGSDERMSQVIRRVMPADRLSSVVSLIGPSHAEEVIERQLTSIDAVSLKEDDAKAVQLLFSNQYLRIYTGDDEIGSELGAAVKNVMAIASGIIAGLGYKDNTRAALITRGLQEMIRFGTRFGGRPETFVGLTGIGDLIVTCSSINSRNFQAGLQIGKENDVTHFLQTNKKTTEGIRTAKVVHDIAAETGIDMPICEEVYQILFEGKEPKNCACDLMLRDLKKEF